MLLLLFAVENKHDAAREGIRLYCVLCYNCIPIQASGSDRWKETWTRPGV